MTTTGTATTQVQMQDRSGRTITVTRHATYLAAVRSMSHAQRTLHTAEVWALPGGGYDLFPLGHPVPAGAQRVSVGRVSTPGHERGVEG